ncbi:TIR-like protein FxsC [Streptomyces sp. NRRL WC-3742]|uniref:TIR-like protein FxsC n=1 Tax=Streptomyces sp. NRRL WC-3742 TaxID=1463934 RepID=UPI00068FC1A7|nr:TIR-like protein FxsC [Streptomyces sp. NRRL WC-3742]
MIPPRDFKRALRPLRHPGPHGPAKPSLDLAIVLDDGPTMAIWQPFTEELSQLATGTGYFRTVRLLGRAQESPLPLLRPGRTAVLVVSDCTGPRWWPGEGGSESPWHRSLHDWATAAPTAVVQPLPERLWRRTALPATPGLLTARSHAAPNTDLAFTPYRADDTPQDHRLPVPVLEPTVPWLNHWARIVAGRSGRVPGAAAFLPAAPAPEHDPPDDPGALSAEQLVLRFRAVATPEVFRLAGHLAIGVPNLPVMRFVQSAVLPHPDPQQLAEIIVSGMLTAVPGATGHYEFRPGVREVLVRTVPRSAYRQTAELLRREGHPTAPPVPGPDEPRPAPPVVTLPTAAPIRHVPTYPPVTRTPVLDRDGPLRPYFFFSCARRDSEAEDPSVDQFFNDLRDELGRIEHAARAEELGFREAERLRLGDDWAEEIGRMLGRSRTMVALYSPAYFASRYCGKEWAAFRGRVRRHHEEYGEHVPALIPVLWEPVDPGDLHNEVIKVSWAQPDLGGTYARHGLHTLMRADPGGEAYRRVVHAVARRVRDAAGFRLGELPDFDLGAVRGYFPTAGASSAMDSPGLVRLFVAAGRASEAPAASGAHYGPDPWDWTPYHPPVQPSLVARAQRVITAAGHTTTVEEIRPGLGAKLDQAREDSQVCILLVDPWAADSERYRDALREYDDQNHPTAGVLVPSIDRDPAGEREEPWTGVRGVFRRNWLRRNDPERLFRVKVRQEDFDTDLTIMATVLQNKLMDEQIDWADDARDAFGYGFGPGGGPDVPGLAIPSGPRPFPDPPGPPGLRNPREGAVPVRGNEEDE